MPNQSFVHAVYNNPIAAINNTIGLVNIDKTPITRAPAFIINPNPIDTNPATVTNPKKTAANFATLLIVPAIFSLVSSEALTHLSINTCAAALTFLVKSVYSGMSSEPIDLANDVTVFQANLA